MRRLAAASLLIVCAVLTSGCGLLDEVRSQPELGSLETFETKGFTIKLPCIPAEEKQSVPLAGGKPLTVRMWICDGGNVAYAAGAMALPKDVQLDLDLAAQGAAEGVKGDVVSKKKVTYAGVPGRDIRVEFSADGKPATMFMRVLVHQRTTYHVQVIVSEDGATKPPPLFNRILKSLSFT